MESKPLRFHITEGANNHIKQSDSVFFARNPIGVAYNRLPAMLTIAIHNIRLFGKEHAMGILPVKTLESPSVAKVFTIEAKNAYFDPLAELSGIPASLSSFC
jgi:hypothetical protein